MEKEFWKSAWNEGKTGFHRDDFHPELIEFFPKLNIQKTAKVLVPLSGKSKDLLWLSHNDYYPFGVEVVPQAVSEFFSENKMETPTLEKRGPLDIYTHEANTVIQGSFFDLKEQGFKGYFDSFYCRASIVALPKAMRKDYADTLNQLLFKGAQGLMITFEYDQTLVGGPPFSVEEKEVHELFSHNFEIIKLDSKSQKPKAGKFKDSGIPSFTQVVYQLVKTS